MIMQSHLAMVYFFFFNDTATTEIYTLSLHDALPICSTAVGQTMTSAPSAFRRSTFSLDCLSVVDRKSTRLNSSHLVISYAVFCLKKKKMISTGFSHHTVYHTMLQSHTTDRICIHHTT